MEKQTAIQVYRPKPPTISEQHLQTLRSKVCSVEEVELGFVETVEVGYYNQIRHGDKVTTRERVFLEIESVSGEYGRTVEIAFAVRKECARLMLTRFSVLSLDEIREAFRYWAQKPGDAKTKPQMWGGVMDAGFFTSIMADYCEARKKVLGALLAEIAAVEDGKETEERIQRMKDRFETAFNNDLARAKSEKWEPDRIPEFWYNIALERQLMEFTHEQKAQAWREAQILAKKKIQVEHATSMDSIRRRELMTIIESGGYTDSAVTIAKKLLLHRFLISPK